jgi:DNA-directed RNA polymerase specialized sigma24 family protein
MNSLDDFKIIYEKYKVSTFETALMITGNYHAAEDITQNVVTRLYTKLYQIKNSEF